MHFVNSFGINEIDITYLDKRSVYVVSVINIRIMDKFFCPLKCMLIYPHFILCYLTMQFI